MVIVEQKPIKKINKYPQTSNFPHLHSQNTFIPSYKLIEWDK